MAEFSFLTSSHSPPATLFCLLESERGGGGGEKGSVTQKDSRR